MDSLRMLTSSLETPEKNLALEHSIIESKIPTLRLWRNTDTVVLGRTQNYQKEVNLPYCSENKIAVNRRISSGGTVFHDLGNLNISFFLPLKWLGKDIMTGVGRLTLLLYDSLSGLGIENLAIHNLSNLTFKGNKISGSAQYLRSGFLLHHATLLVSSNLEKLEGSLLSKEIVPIERNASKYYPTTNLENFDEKKFTQEISSMIEDEFHKPINGGILKEVELQRMDELVRSIYSKDHWVKEGRLKSRKSF